MSPSESPAGQPLAAWIRIALALVGLIVGAGILVAGIGMLGSGSTDDPGPTTTRPAISSTATLPPSSTSVPTAPATTR